jgi:hypothetical protein
MQKYGQAVQEVGKLIYKLVYGSDYSMTVTAHIFSKFLIIWQVVVKNSDIEFHISDK